MSLVLLLALSACHKKQDDTNPNGGKGGDDTGQPSAETGGDDTADDSGEPGETNEPEETGDTGSKGDPRGWTTVPLADLAPLSSGACPRLDESGSSTFLSSEEERRVTVLLPEDGPEDAPVVFFFHGLSTPDATPEPAEYLAEALGLQDVADELGVVIVLPEAPLREMFGVQFFLWEVESTESNDLVLYDDLRTCLSDELDVDLERVSAVGFSGGALFVTEVISQRADTLASFVELSGGSDVDVALLDMTLAPYATPAWTLPGLLVSGGESDVWPDPSFAVVDFEAATDTLTEELVMDSHYLARCYHERGHTITWDAYELTLSWVLAHRFGEPTPYATEGLGDATGWCEVRGG